MNGESFLFCFPFNTSNILFHCLFAYIIYGQKYDKSFMIRNFFPLDNYHTCVFWASWICDMMSVINFEKFLAIIMSSISSSFYFSFQHSYYTIFNCLTVLECCIFFFFLHFSLEMFLLTCPQAYCFIPCLWSVHWWAHQSHPLFCYNVFW